MEYTLSLDDSFSLKHAYLPLILNMELEHVFMLSDH
jgi:hypothetical protein